ncbi:hypothetical protein GE061_018292 [Apolygus lucorum]|uniref:Uncharacterized protein n=1 Tax=Apolygus lucorum TaxID=248454 RepID=A0A6A4J1P2_APOLU|nr:hypothetical protein GE061_018292 [Apolygus lucorum]
MIFFVIYSSKSDAVHKDDGPSRKKRVINGLPVLDLNSEYRSVKYVVWMASSHSCDSFLTIRYKPCAPSSRFNRCGGSLLTPSIVQTNCHCVARFAEDRVDGYRRHLTRTVWEDAYTIYPGAIPVEKVTGVKAQNYISHPRCKEHPSRVVLHDYGVISLRSAVDARGVVPAPVYSIDTLAEIWINVMAKKAVCLYVSYGAYRVKSNNEVKHGPPPVLLHGWVRALNYLECREILNPSWNDSDDTIFCLTTQPPRNQYSSPGDSGSPVSCNNQYAGMDSFSAQTLKGAHHIVSISMSTAFTIFENSVEYREAFSILVQVFSEYDPTARAFLYRPTVPEIREHFRG